MPIELFEPAWEIPELTLAELGPYGDFPRASDDEKQALWAAYRAGRPARTPVSLGTNARVFVLDPRFGAPGLDYARIFEDPQAMLLAELRWQHLLRRRHNVCCDAPTGLPARWAIGAGFQNTSEAAFFGAPLHFDAGNVPDTRPWLDDANKHAVFDVDVTQPLTGGLYPRGIAFTEWLRTFVADKTWLGRPIDVLPYTAGSDGPLTVGLNLRGPALLVDLRRDPDYAHRLFERIVVAAINRLRAFQRHWGTPDPEQVWLADDSIALLGPAQYRQHVLPYHQQFYEALDPQRTRPRGMHLCGDATRHFRTIRDACGVTIFDTGFPVDFAALRAELGPEIELFGGVEVPLLMQGTPEQVYARARAILASGVRTGGRFGLREANNLPPGAPWSNLAAMYKAAWDAE
jgi:hypothetical protein